MVSLGERMLFVSRMKQRGFTVCFSKSGNIVGKRCGKKSGARPRNLKSNFVFGLGRVWS